MVKLRNKARTKIEKSWLFFKDHPLIFGLSLLLLLIILFVSNIFGFTISFILLFFVTPVIYYKLWAKIGRPAKSWTDRMLGISPSTTKKTKRKPKRKRK